MGREQPAVHFGKQIFVVGPTGATEYVDFMIAEDYKLRAKNKDAYNHGKKRVGLSFIYLMFIRELARNGLLRLKLKKVDAGLQFRSGSGNFQAAHQILCELGCGRDGLYDIALNAGNRPLSRALAYCSAATTDGHESINHADGWLEKNCRDNFCELANGIRTSHDMHPGDIWLRLISLFEAGCVTALAQVRVKVHAKQDQGLIEKELLRYSGFVVELRARKALVAQRDVGYWIQHILIGGYGDPVIHSDSASASAASSIVMGQSTSAPPPR